MKRIPAVGLVAVVVVTMMALLPATAQAAPQDAYQIYICHGPTDGSGCGLTEPRNEPNEEHEFHVLVVDAEGKPVPGVSVTMRETGPAIFTPQGGSTITVVTDANGFAYGYITSDVDGTSTIQAEIVTEGAACNAGGQCLSATLTKYWEEIIDCGDGLDNDEDGLLDADDGGCVDANDGSERIDTARNRSISIRFNDGTGARNNGLIVFGRLRAPGFPDCRSGQPVNIQRRVSGRFRRIARTRTNSEGEFKKAIDASNGTFRAVAGETEIENPDADTLDICEKTVKAGAP